jgi:hypothetical protein
MAMMSSSTRVREESYDSISTITQPIVAPASFLSHHHNLNYHHTQETDDEDDYGYSDEDDVRIPAVQDQIEWHDTFGTHPSMWQSKLWGKAGLVFRDQSLFFFGSSP